MLKLTDTHVEGLAVYLLEGLQGADLSLIQWEHIADMIHLYIEGDKAADIAWLKWQHNAPVNPQFAGFEKPIAGQDY